MWARISTHRWYTFDMFWRIPVGSWIYPPSIFSDRETRAKREMYTHVCETWFRSLRAWHTKLWNNLWKSEHFKISFGRSVVTSSYGRVDAAIGMITHVTKRGKYQRHDFTYFSFAKTYINSDFFQQLLLYFQTRINLYLTHLSHLNHNWRWVWHTPPHDG